jgi:formate hydrogenlyase subunit 4
METDYSLIAGKILNLAAACLAAPFLLGVINRTKAIFAGRKGQPLLQPYYDVIRLLRKGAVYSTTTSWIFRTGPVAAVAVTLAAATMVPQGGTPALLSFKGDLLMVVYLFGLLRFLTVLSALDTGSSFEGMGASREVTFAALAEPPLLIGLATIAYLTGHTSLSMMTSAVDWASWVQSAPVFILLGAAFLAVFLTENCRIPVDDPNTHLELTMIHEVMVLDHGGPDFGFIVYGAALRMWLLGQVMLGLLLPIRTSGIFTGMLFSVVSILLLGVLVGIIESCMARLRLMYISRLLAAAATFTILALILALR